MNERTLRALVEAGAVIRTRIVANGERFYVEAETRNGVVVVSTLRGGPKVWARLDSAAKWVRGVGLGTVGLDLTHWQPRQRPLRG